MKTSYTIIAWIPAAFMLFGQAQAYELPADPEFDELLSLDLNALTVTSVSKRDEHLNDTAAAIYVITQEDLRRSGVTSIPEALRMVPGLEVAKVSLNRWAITSRGFNGTSANKLQVLIDGRAIYTPVFSGTYWDDQGTLIEDIDRIEVIRGPGASLWGANAVNGVINVITKRADQTQGNLVSFTANHKGGLAEARHGGRIDDNTYYRTYVTYLDSYHARAALTDGEYNGWYRARSGFRMDKMIQGGDSYTLQGDIYGGPQQTINTVPQVSGGTLTAKSDDTSFGGNIIGRWNHQLSKDSILCLQGYVDHYTRNEFVSKQHVSTGDVQLHHSIKLDDRNNFIWGGGARLYVDDLIGSYSINVHQRWADHYILNTFLQDEYALIPTKLYWTLGSKFEFNDFSGFEVQPTTRLAWHPTDNQTIWGAVSRAVRTPSSIAEDFHFVSVVTPGTPPSERDTVGNRNQQSERLIAYELGHRIQPRHDLSFDTTVYWNDFSKLRTFGSPGAPFINAFGNTEVQVPFNNLGSGHVYGAELAVNWNVSQDWKLAGGYTYLKMDLDVKPGTFATLDSTERLAPRHQFSIRSYWNVTDSVHWDNTLYYVDHISQPVNDYLRLDTRLAWLVRPGLELSIIGKNLLEPSHAEFPSNSQYKVNRNVIGQVLWKF